MKRCANCKIEKDDSEFSVDRRKGKTYLGSYCKSCRSTLEHERRKKDPDYAQRSNDYNRAKARINAALVANARTGVPCKDCGGVYSTVATVHYYRRKGGKRMTMTAPRGWALRRLRTELAMCDVVCLNCAVVRDDPKAAAEGFEPSYAGPKPAVLPLDDAAKAARHEALMELTRLSQEVPGGYR